jgi:protein O-GlcNAc transferase
LSHAEALAQLRAGRPQSAVALLEAHLHSNSSDSQAWFLLGACRQQLDELAGAGAAFTRCLDLEPRNLEGHIALISILRARGSLDDALLATTRARSIFPEDARLLYATALILEDLCRNDGALEHYDRALSIDPRLEDALHNRGILLSRLGNFEAAAANQQRYVQEFPHSLRARSVLVDALLALRQFEKALESLDALDRLAPRDTEAQIRRGVALAGLRRYAEASVVFADARTYDPQAVARYVQRIAPGSDLDAMLSPVNLFLWQSWLAQGCCDWSSWSAGLSEMRRLASTPDIIVEPAVAFMAFHLPLSGNERLAVARHIAAGFDARYPALPSPPASRTARIRVGILSPDLRDHLNAYLLLPLFELLDRKRFELYAYSLSAHDHSAIGGRVRAAADHVRDLHAVSDQEAAATIRGDDIDILVDAGGHTTGGRFGITAQRPARLQVNYLGFPGSLGSSRVDHAIVDRIVEGAPEEWSEGRAYLPHTYFLYDFRGPVPATAVSRKDYALPEGAFVYCAFHKAEKISPDAFLLWARILHRVPHSVLWLLALSPVAQHNLRKEAAGHEIDPARLIFAPFDPRERYLARQRLGDLMLDAVNHNAMTTACDALAATLPVLTLRGSAMASRAGESLLRAAGLPELVAPDRDAYVRMAVQIAADPARLDACRRTLAARTGPLFHTAARVRELEAAFLELWQQYASRQ